VPGDALCHAVPREPKCVEDRGACTKRQGFTAAGEHLSQLPAFRFPCLADSAYSFPMSSFLGFDGGGTKTHCVLTDESGKVLAQTSSGPSNPLRVGFDAAANALKDAALSVLGQAGASSSDVKAVCAGLAGTALPENAEKMRAALALLFPGAALRVMTDLELALAALPPGPAIVLVAGTGSAVVGRDSLGRVSRLGGHGRDTSDQGSAFDVGRAAIDAISRRILEPGPAPALVPLILRQLGCATWEDVQKKSRSNPDAVFPRVFPVLAAAADSGDPLARSLLTGAARKLAALVKSLASLLQLEAPPFVLAKTGGMIGRSSFFDSTLDWLLREAAPQASISLLPVAPAEVAACLAIELAHLSGSAAP
jgi:N-acetylglucosamine kinase-like BadF-type ATPase